MEDIILCENCKPFGYCKQKVRARQNQGSVKIVQAANNTNIKGLAPVVITDFQLGYPYAIRALDRKNLLRNLKITRQEI
jgi:hypothetical protein